MLRKIKLLTAIILSLFIISVLTSCKNLNHALSGDEINETLEKDKITNRNITSNVPDNILSSLMPDLKTDINAITLENEKRFDISVRDMPANEFLMSLIEDTPYNMVVPESVTTPISLFLKQVTISEVMEHIKSVYSIDYKITKNGYEIIPQKSITMTYFIDYLDVSRSGSSSTSISSTSITTTGGSSGSSVNTTSENKFWENLTNGIEAIIGTGDDKSVVINSQASVVIVRAPYAEQESVKKYIDALQQILHRQVILEVKILEVKLSDRYQAGINWAAVSKHATSAFTGGGSSISGSELTSDIAKKSYSSNVNLTPGSISFPDELLSADLFGGIFGTVLEFADFSMFLEFLEGQGNVQVLSSPRISTVNNQKAIIKVGTDEYFVTGVETSSTVSNGDSVQNAPSIDLQPFFSGIALDVTPQIGNNDIITLHVHPSVSSVSDSTKKIELTGSTQSLPLAKSSIRETDSIIKARNGQIVVIGGLIEHTSDEVVTNLPILGQIPFLGALFRQTRQNDVKSELVVLIRPTLTDVDLWNNEIERSLEGFKNLKRNFHLGTRANVFGAKGELEW